MKIGLYFGSFNPIHIGHLAIANYFVEFTEIEQLWFVISPHNPLKSKDLLIEDHLRFQMVHLAIGKSEKYKVSTVEFEMPKPSYTIDTLNFLKANHPESSFTIIMGSDNLIDFHKWKNYKEILKNHEIYVYPRPGYNCEKYVTYSNLKIYQAPLLEISSSFIRDSINEGKDMVYFFHPEVYTFIREKNLYTV